MRLTSDINNASENPSETDNDWGTAEIDLDVYHLKIQILKIIQSY